MQPQLRFIRINNGIDLVPQLLSDLFIQPRIKAIEWSRTTFQTPNMNVGYPGQHLVSLVTGVPGERSGARGNDLMDGSEIKSCSFVDQVDKCKECSSSVLRTEETCPECESINIDRKKDSKWIFAIRSEFDLNQLTSNIDRIVLILADYPNYSTGNYDDIRFEIFEIWPNSERCIRFVQLMESYYYDNYLVKINQGRSPSPKNFHPHSYAFYMCNPIKTFSAIVSSSLTNPTIMLNEYIPAQDDRESYNSLSMPKSILKRSELELLNRVPIEVLRQDNPDFLDIDDPVEIISRTTTINEQIRSYLPLRDETTFTMAQPYQRRQN